MSFDVRKNFLKVIVPTFKESNCKVQIPTFYRKMNPGSLSRTYDKKKYLRRDIDIIV
ncbi:hypothetical protein LEP1GSC082_0218 [Leptospira kirschneri str. H2]|uniref:Uncharacterized protein n=2 Tax=Leptospira kirschneri TaxID=29507 RepID=A0A0E2B166_9LEPT|nr:hypothetical protein LEP1GSC081_1909 [Leptospira kirschneri str. H1]EKO58730.1 hypothetical protein LEP1GSC082_0218 [Leptospira kirschneri str. H2]EMK20071.1 hypothetical protein LEP1GSC008_3071 [Leptospira kirschneri serovar Bulgarica str. Nikolaevo]